MSPLHFRLWRRFLKSNVCFVYNLIWAICLLKSRKTIDNPVWIHLKRKYTIPINYIEFWLTAALHNVRVTRPKFAAKLPLRDTVTLKQEHSHEWENNIHTLSDISHSGVWHWIWLWSNDTFLITSFTLHLMRLLIDQNILEPNYRQQSDLNPDGAAAHPFFGAKKPFINVTTTVVQSHIWWGRCYNQNQQPSGVMLHWANGCGFWSINYFHKNMIVWSEWGIPSQGLFHLYLYDDYDPSDEWFRSHNVIHQR